MSSPFDGPWPIAAATKLPPQISFSASLAFSQEYGKTNGEGEQGSIDVVVAVDDGIAVEVLSDVAGVLCVVVSVLSRYLRRSSKRLPSPLGHCRASRIGRYCRGPSRAIGQDFNVPVAMTLEDGVVSCLKINIVITQNICGRGCCHSLQSVWFVVEIQILETFPRVHDATCAPS